MENINQIVREKMEKAIASLKRDLSTLRTGRANPSLLDKIQVDYYGNLTPIKQMANISTPDPRSLIITPWDKSTLAEIERSIMKSDMGLTPQNDGNIIRINLPVLTAERRNEMVKISKKMGEESKISIRNIRRDANDDIKKVEKNSEIPEDLSRRYQEEVQKLTNDFIKRCDEILSEKEKEITEV